MTFLEALGTNLDNIKTICDNITDYYLSYPIRKSNGKLRWIDAPLDELKDIQKRILFKLLYKFSPHPAAVGFIAGIGVKDGVKRHFGNRVLLCADISNFFGSIRTNEVYRLMHHLLRTLLDREWIDLGSLSFGEAREILVTLTTYKGHLPQGTPTSPALANLFSINMDHRLQELADLHGLIYTRYADDITFSCENKTYNIGQLIPQISDIVREFKLTLNKDKTRVMRPHKRMTITGVVVNDKLGIPKYKRRNFRAKLHNLIRDDVAINEKELQQLRGYAEWIRNLNEGQGNFFLQKIGRLRLRT
jgi:retron-type reverse transcriptase